MSRTVWHSHQLSDNKLGPILKFLSLTATGKPEDFSKQIRTRAQSYRLWGGLLEYRSVRDVGSKRLHQGWVLAVPTSLRTMVVRECHKDGMHGHGGIRKTVMAIRQRYHFKGIRRFVSKSLLSCVKCKRAKTLVDSLSVPLSPAFARLIFLLPHLNFILLFPDL